MTTRLKGRVERLEAEQREARARCVKRLVGLLSTDELIAFVAWYEARERGGPAVDAETEALVETVRQKLNQAMTPAELALWG